MKNKDTSLGVIFIFCRSRCMASGRDVAKCDDALCPLFTRRLGHDPKRSHRTLTEGQKSVKGKFTPLPDGVKKTTQVIPNILTINGRTFKEVKEDAQN